MTLLSVCDGNLQKATDYNRYKKWNLKIFFKYSWRNALKSFIEYINDEEPYYSQDERTAVDENKPHKPNLSDYPTIPFKHKTPREPNDRLRFQVFQRDNYKCYYCGASPAKDSSVVLHIDHIKPWSKGGETTIDNLRTSCSKCNLGKSDIYE